MAINPPAKDSKIGVLVKETDQSVQHRDAESVDQGPIFETFLFYSGLTYFQGNFLFFTLAEGLMRKGLLSHRHGQLPDTIGGSENNIAVVLYRQISKFVVFIGIHTECATTINWRYKTFDVGGFILHDIISCVECED